MNVLRLLRTRGWIVLLSAVLVIGVALAVRELKPPGYTAEAVLVVPANSGAVNPGSADQAVRLTDTYERLIPQNRELLRSVAKRTSLTTKDVRGAVTVRRRAGDALLEVSFTAHNAGRAISGANAFGELLGRGVPGIPAQGITVVSKAQNAVRLGRSQAGPRFRASTVALVSSGAGGPGPGNADQANKLATTFAGLIPNDQEVLRSAGRRVGRSTTQVSDRLSVVNDAETSLLRIRYRGDDPAEALRGARLVAEAVAGLNPVAGAIPSRALNLVRLPTKTSSVYGTGVLLGVAGALGVALGLLLLVVLERADPRIADPRTAARMLGTPVIAARRLTPEAADLLVRDWYEASVRAGRALDDRASTVGMVPVTREAAFAAREIAARLSESDAAGDRDVVTAGRTARRGRTSGSVEVAEWDAPPSFAAPTGPRQARIQVVAFDRDERDPDLKRDQGLDVAAIVRNDLVVLVVARDTRARRVAATVDLLAELGRTPSCAILTGRHSSELPTS